MRFRIRNITDEKYQYALDARDASRVRLLGVLGLISLIFVILGYVQFLHISAVLAAFFAPVLLITTLYYTIQFFLLSRYPGFDLGRHKQRIATYWRKTTAAPRIAVFIPAAGESTDVVAQTVQAASRIRYPNFQVFVLDDSKDALYKQLAADFGIAYIRRQHIGRFKKAGNMNHALKQIRGYDHILVLDADFQARPEILHELVPYTAENVGIIQSPQHFPLDDAAHARSKIEYGAAYIQKDFYRITQVARNAFGAAICVGTGALYNVEALTRVGGYEGVGEPKGWSHSEDVHTGLKMINSYNDSDERYRIIYIPIQLAKGTCPDTHHSFYKQQNRWATGSMQLILSTKTIRSDKLTILQRIIYGSNGLYYLYTMALLLSPLYLLTLALSSHPNSWAFTLYFIPSLLFKHVIEPFVMRRTLAPIATTLVVLSNAYTFLQAALLLIIRRPLGWEATGSKTSKKSLHFTFFKLGAMLGFIMLYILTLGVLIMNERFQVGPSIFIVCLFLTSFLAHLSFLFYTLVITSESRHKLTDRKFYAAIAVVVITAGVVCAALSHHGTYDVVLQNNRIAIEPQNNNIKSTDTPLDGYRRSLGDVKQMLGLN
jgi:cellulose synthase (UDP-forming)